MSPTNPNCWKGIAQLYSPFGLLFVKEINMNTSISIPIKLEVWFLNYWDDQDS